MPEVLSQKPGSQVQAQGQKAKGSLLKSLCLWWTGFSKCLGHPVPVKAGLGHSSRQEPCCHEEGLTTPAPD